ncbi:hypothetical protein KC929_01310 [Patescibacteria group bacterium]|nr:hypothetical protein [Patescibacteria group bacterium]
MNLKTFVIKPEQTARQIASLVFASSSTKDITELSGFSDEGLDMYIHRYIFPMILEKVKERELNSEDPAITAADICNEFAGLIKKRKEKYEKFYLPA